MIVDQFTRECVTLLAENTLSGEKVAAHSTRRRYNAMHSSRSPLITATSRVSTAGCVTKCLNVKVFFNLVAARRQLSLWRRDYNHHL